MPQASPCTAARGFGIEWGMDSVCADPKGIYFIGIGGVSMSALALLLQDRGYSVRGSDAVLGETTARLAACGIPVSRGEGEEITEPTVVYTGAVDARHPQLAAAMSAGKRLIARAELLGRFAEGFPHTLSVAGCHGKTTASCMLAHVLSACAAPFTAHIGGEDLDFGNCRIAGREYFVTEACEFKRSFLSLKSSVAVILNCDRDHTDCYRNDGETFAAYSAFAAQAKEVVVNADDPRARRIPHTTDFGLFAGEIRAEQLVATGEKYAFTIAERGIPVVRVSLRVVGKVHIYNALAAYAAARRCGFAPAQIKEGLEAFRGVKRRFERVGTIGGAEVVCDYAHHPREIAATIATAQKLCRGELRVVFQPHTYTRTRDFLADFVRVLGGCERPIVYSTYSAREAFDFAGSACRLAASIPDARYVQSPQQLKRRLTEGLTPRDLVLVLGAGDIYAIVRSILD